MTTEPVDLDTIARMPKEEAYAWLIRLGKEPHKFERKLAHETLERVHRAWANDVALHEGLLKTGEPAKKLVYPKLGIA